MGVGWVLRVGLRGVVASPQTRRNGQTGRPATVTLLDKIRQSRGTQLQHGIEHRWMSPCVLTLPRCAISRRPHTQNRSSGK
jgi:hypothetical protein